MSSTLGHRAKKAIMVAISSRMRSSTHRNAARRGNVRRGHGLWRVPLRDAGAECCPIKTLS
jgi:hypothetical protein